MAYKLDVKVDRTYMEVLFSFVLLFLELLFLVFFFLVIPHLSNIRQ